MATTDRFTQTTPEAKVAELILELRAGGISYSQIATEVGLSASRVGEIVRANERDQILESLS
ncbi:hypothetical protein [Leucobacter salsicius]|uniref:hypothetical protein n=1 Tax=Leucobacter salsicius TaxID=664638 RepID=UPI00034810A3|nr:hypothetical protein [Leucobacter salsicius]